MKCSVCGGALKCQSGLYTCINCGTKQGIMSFFENAEVFICYLENDNQGRRTKDSIIAQEIYHKLENAKINTFYQRISAADLLGDDLKSASQTAASRAQVIVLCATTKENFIKLLDENKQELINKKVIPVYASMNAYDIPEELGKLQAINYSNIGATTDLINNLLRFLHKKTEKNISLFADEKRIKKRKQLMVSIWSVLIVGALILTYITLGTPYVLKSKKSSYAEQLVAKGEYIEAIDILTQLENYKNSKLMLKNIYDKYEGYYYDETLNVLAHIVIENDSRLELEFEQKDSVKGLTKFSEKSKIEGSKISVNFNDNLGREGTAVVQLGNDAIYLIIESEKNINIKFDLNEKSDAPLKEKLSKKDLLLWVQSAVSINEIKALGYKPEYLEPLASEEGIVRYYQISNTNIRLITSAYDAREESFSSFVWNVNVYDNPFVMAIECPAILMCPERIGEADDTFIEEGFKYYPNGVPYEGVKQSVISKDTPIVVISEKAAAGNEFVLPEKWFYQEEYNNISDY